MLKAQARFKQHTPKSVKHMLAVLQELNKFQQFFMFWIQLQEAYKQVVHDHALVTSRMFMNMNRCARSGFVNEELVQELGQVNMPRGCSNIHRGAAVLVCGTHKVTDLCQ